MSRFSRKALVLMRLAKPGAPRVFSPGSLVQWLEEQDITIPPRTLTESLAEWSATGAIDRVTSRIYLNGRAQPRPTLDEAAPHLRPGAIVSLHRVLGQHGVLNNPSHWVTAVVSSADTTKVGRVETESAIFRFAALPDALTIRPGHKLHALAVEEKRPWMATPEKALLDWLHLANTPRGAASWPLPGAYDWDLDLLDHDRLDALAAPLDLGPVLDNFRARVAGGALDPSPKQRARRPR